MSSRDVGLLPASEDSYKNYEIPTEYQNEVDVEGETWNGRIPKLILGRNCAIFFLVVGILMMVAAGVCLGTNILPATWAKPVIISLLFTAGGFITLASLISLFILVPRLNKLLVVETEKLKKEVKLLKEVVSERKAILLKKENELHKIKKEISLLSSGKAPK
jgi:hypothetical protein